MCLYLRVDEPDVNIMVNLTLQSALIDFELSLETEYVIFEAETKVCSVQYAHRKTG